MHEAEMYGEKNAFITLTYDDELSANYETRTKLVYRDFQLFAKKLRKTQSEPIGYFCTGEYGDRKKRPHWHAILFNWHRAENPGRPSGKGACDSTLKYTTELGHRVYTSETLTKTWGNGSAEFGTVTLHSAGYCARYAAKKLGHGKDGTHEFEPISKKSSKHAIGKKWLEKNWKDVFTQGYIITKDGDCVGVPRYYERWLKENLPDEWTRYVTEVKPRNVARAQAKTDRSYEEFIANWNMRRDQNLFAPVPFSPLKRREIIQAAKFNRLQEFLKL